MLFRSEGMGQSVDLSSLEQTVLTQADILANIKTLIVPAIVATILAVFVYRAIAKNNHRLEHVKAIFVNNEEVETNKNGRLLTLPILLVIVYCIFVMIKKG